MVLEIVKEARPVERQSVLLEVLQRKRETVVDADERRFPSESLSTSHSAMLLRLQYLRGLGGGWISCGAVKRSAA
jgi:hypothetical protein